MLQQLRSCTDCKLIRFVVVPLQKLQHECQVLLTAARAVLIYACPSHIGRATLISVQLIRCISGHRNSCALAKHSVLTVMLWTLSMIKDLCIQAIHTNITAQICN